MRALHPAIEPYDEGMLDVGDGQRIHWEASGNRDGKPAVMIHGGPGSGLAAGSRRFFDPSAYRLIQFDQRGCGRSTPHAGDLSTALETNTTHHLIADIERLREHLEIDRWLVRGVSWGVTLGLAYAERHPERVSEAVLASITISRAADVHWFAHEAGRFFPEAWTRFRAAVPGPERDGDLVAAYDRLLNEDPDPAVRERAARDWCNWEDALLSLDEGYEVPNPRWADPRFRMGFARLVTHYFHHVAWLDEDELLRNAGRLAGIPAVLVHGRFDIGGPPDVAWKPARAWPDADLYLVGTGHSGGDEMDQVQLEALDRLARGGGAAIRPR